MSKRIVTGYRHITEAGEIKKVEFIRKTDKYYIKGTTIELTKKQITQKANVQHDGCGKNAVIVKVKPSKRKKSYADWWDESNLDGSFAYNGVTDDF